MSVRFFRLDFSSSNILITHSNRIEECQAKKSHPISSGDIQNTTDGI